MFLQNPPLAGRTSIGYAVALMGILSFDNNDPIAALATPWGESAVAVVRTSGAGTLSMVQRCFAGTEDLSSATSHTLVHGTLMDPETNTPVDDVLCAVFRQGRGYTGEESVEIYAHGSLPGIELILGILRGLGFRDAQPGEFTLRAFLNGRLDLTQAEAVQELVASKSRRAHTLALHRLEGGIRKRVDQAKTAIKELLGAAEIQLDYPEDEVEIAHGIDPVQLGTIQNDLLRLRSTYGTGRLFQEGARIALSGLTNAGKSSLFNLFVKEDRSIVSDIHGTTRDFVHQRIIIRGIPVTLYDTAGLRAEESADRIEREGIKRSGEVSQGADLILYLVDATRGIEAGETKALAPDRTIFVWSKADAADSPPPENFIAVSSATGEGFRELEETIETRLQGTAGAAAGADALIDSLRQRDLLDRAIEALEQVGLGIGAGFPLDAVAVDLREALDALGEITGEITTEEVLKDMFSRFCVGK